MIPYLQVPARRENLPMDAYPPGGSSLPTEPSAPTSGLMENRVSSLSALRSRVVIPFLGLPNERLNDSPHKKEG